MLTSKKMLILVAVLMSTSVGTYAQTVHELDLDMVLDRRTMTVQRIDPTATTPRRGDTFIVSGKLYPGGTIPAGGTPAEPLTFDIDTLEGALGEWNCRGTFDNDLEAIQMGARHVMTTVHYIFDDGDSMVSDGPEPAANPVVRAIVGGTGQYAGAQGQVFAERIGRNITGGGNFRFKFTFVTPTVLSFLVKNDDADASSKRLQLAKMKTIAPVQTQTPILGLNDRTVSPLRVDAAAVLKSFPWLQDLNAVVVQ